MRSVLLCALLATMTTPFGAPSNAAPEDGPLGRKCGFNSAIDVTREPGWQIGDINAGPLLTGTGGTLHCKIIVNSNSHSAPFAVDESVVATGGHVAVMEPRSLRYRATAADTVDLCTSWVPDSGPALYWVVPGSSLELAYWDTDPNAPCRLPMNLEPNNPECGIWLAIDERLGTNIAEIWQDCESYEPYPLPAAEPDKVQDFSVTIHAQGGVIATRFTTPTGETVPHAPPGWTCQSSDLGNVYTLDCQPDTGPYDCRAPYVLTSQVGTAVGSVTGLVACGTKSASCWPSPLLPAANYCETSIRGPARVTATGPFRCRASYATPNVDQWTVSCRTYR